MAYLAQLQRYAAMLVSVGPLVAEAKTDCRPCFNWRESMVESCNPLIV